MIAADALPALLVQHLPAHLARQRWSGLQGREVDAVDVVWLDVVQPGDPLLVWGLVEAQLSDGGRQRYQIYLGGRPAQPPPEFLHGKDHQVVAVVPGDDGDVVLYDALIDPDLAIAVLHLTVPGFPVEVRRPIVLEHSNSSVVFDEATILKVFRKIEPGLNPDVEMTRVLAERGCELVVPPLAELQRDGAHMAVLRTFIVGATEGWQMARTSVRDALASRLAPADCGGDLGPNSGRLGATIAGLHLATADAWGVQPGDVDQWVDGMMSQLAELEQGATPLEVGLLDTDAIRARLTEARAIRDAGAAIRIHGDLHLAQVIRADAGWRVIDFEGEPARRPVDGFTQSSPLRDVAGMLRSYHYAAASGLAEWEPADDELATLARAWELRNRDAFLDGYLSHAGIDGLLPAVADRDALLAAFELDKAVYELGYELTHRPETASIPLAGIARLLSEPASA